MLLVEAGIARLARRLRARQLLAIDLLGIDRGGVCRAGASLRPVHRARRWPASSCRSSASCSPCARCVNLRLGLYSRGWRFASIPDVVRIVGAVVVGTVGARCASSTTLRVVAGPPIAAGFPRSFWPARCSSAIAILGGVRFAIRAAYDWPPAGGAWPSTTAQRLTLLYGAGRTGRPDGPLRRAQPRRRRRAGRLPR